jgi:hypothetical protein
MSSRFAQQAIALILQNRGLERAELEAQLTDLFFDLDANKISQIIGTMLSRSILWQDEGIGGLIGLGETGEDEFGRRHFEAIVSTFNSPLLLTVQHGQRELGFVDPMSIRTNGESAPTLILAGRYWRVVTSDWKSRVVYVEPGENKGKASWLGSSRALRFELCQKMKSLLIDRKVPAVLSNRARNRLDHVSSSFALLETGKTTVERTVAGKRSEWRWWTFAGGAANFLLAEMMTIAGNQSITHDNLSIRLTFPPNVADGMALPAELTQQGEKRIRRIGKDLKFSLCLEDDDASSVVKSRLLDWRGAASIMGQTVVVSGKIDKRTMKSTPHLALTGRTTGRSGPTRLDCAPLALRRHRAGPRRGLRLASRDWPGALLRLAQRFDLPGTGLGLVIHARLAFINLYTTGANPLRDRITKISVLEAEDDQVSTWSTLVNPPRPIPEFIQGDAPQSGSAPPSLA